MRSSGLVALSMGSVLRPTSSSVYYQLAGLYFPYPFLNMYYLYDYGDNINAMLIYCQ